MKTKMRILSIVITVAMLIGMLPVNSLATTEYPEITADMAVTVTLDGSTVTEQLYKFVPEEDGRYIIYSSDNDYDTYGYLLDENMEELTYDDDSREEGNNFQIVWEMVAGNTYYIKARFYTTEYSGSFDITVTKGVSATDLVITPDSFTGIYGTNIQIETSLVPDNAIPENITYVSSAEDIVSVDEYGYVTLHKIGEATITVTSENGLTSYCKITVTDIPVITAEQNVTVDIIAAAECKIFKFTPDKDGTYKFWSTGNFDTYGYILDADRNTLIEHDGGTNFSCTYDLTAGTTYLLKAMMYNSEDTGSFDVSVAMVDDSGNILHDIDTYTYDEDYHYGLCANCGENITQEHRITADDNICYCGFVHEHTYSYNYDKNTHYGSCYCNAYLEEDHSFENGVCECGYFEHDHVFRWYDMIGDTEHYTECAACLCGFFTEHMLNDDGTCVCGYFAHEHDFVFGENLNEYEHEQRCTICYKYLISSHEFDNNGECECGYTDHIHSGEEFYKYSDNHYGICDICKLQLDASHSYNDEGICTCGAIDHEHADIDYVDSQYDYHYEICKECAVIVSQVGHSFDETNTCICGHVYTETDFDDGIYIGDDVILNDGQYLTADGTVTDTEPDKWVAHFADTVLTLQDINIESVSEGVYYDYAENGLEIAVHGNVNITTDDADGIQLYDGNLTISGTGTLRISTLDDYDGIDAAENGDITIEEGVTIIIDAIDSGIEAEEEFIMNGGTLTINAGDEGIDAEDVEINGGVLIINAHNDCIDTDDNITVNDGYLNLTAGSSGFEADGNITAQGGTMVIDADDYGFQAGIDPTYDSILIIDGGSIRITADNGAIASSGLPEISEGMGTVDMVADDEGYYYSIDGDKLLTELVLPTDADTGITASLSASSVYYNGKNHTPELTVTDSEGNTLAEDTDYTAEWSADEMINTGMYVVTVTGIGEYEGLTDYKIFIIKDIAVYVGGVELHSGDYLANGADTVTDTKPAGGYAYFNNGVIELVNYEYEGEGYCYDGIYSSALYAEDELTIILKGKNSLTNTSTDGECITSYNNINISGGGTVTLDGEYGIYCDGYTVTIDSGVVISDCKKESIHAFTLIINGGNLTLVGEMPIYGFEIEINGGTVDIKAIGTAIYSDGYVKTNGGIINIEAPFGICGNSIDLNGGYVKIDATRRAIYTNDSLYGIHIGENTGFIIPENAEIKLVNGSYYVFDDEGLVATNVIFSDKNYGDTNADGSVNLSDVSLLLQYIANWNVTVNEFTADTNGDTKINLSDVTLLLQYIAGWNVTLGK